MFLSKLKVPREAIRSIQGLFAAAVLVLSAYGTASSQTSLGRRKRVLMIWGPQSPTGTTLTP